MAMRWIEVTYARKESGLARIDRNLDFLKA